MDLGSSRHDIAPDIVLSFSCMTKLVIETVLAPSSQFITGAGGERHQLRELKASGGYISFDEPLAHFGLGEYDRVDRLEIGWSTGGTTVIPGPFDAGRFFCCNDSRKIVNEIQLALRAGERYAKPE